ncbi:MAG: NADH-quinone oxidoreductase subunit H [Planctomycetia bacterium]|jgi:NADH-quinone oxidoreductase subunit H
MLPFVLVALIKIGLLIAGLMTVAAYLVLVERWIAAWVQDRRGPNRVGIPLTKIRLFGIGQPIADGGKFFFKEEFTPGYVDRILYFLGPIILFSAAMTTFAVIPFGSVLPEIPGLQEPIELVVAPGMDVGIVFVFALGSIAVYGVLLAGWASNNKYGFLGALRSAAQLISYELPLGLGIVGVVLAAGSLRLETIIEAQAVDGVWNVVLQPLGFLVFFVAGFAESGRLPFDLSEAEQELVGGFHTEYSGMKLMMLLVSEFLHLFVVSFMLVILFFGGWHLWGITGSGSDVTWPVAIARVVILLGKVLLTGLFFIMARWTWPRFRFDQMMTLVWQVIIPLGLVHLVAVAVWSEYGVGWAEMLGMSYYWANAIWGWSVFIVAMIALCIFVPETTDNRPRIDL